MEVKILLKETIKPYSSTPPHLKNYNLSLVDQLSPPIYIPTILFYSSTPESSFPEKSDRLKKSLSKTLALFYPLAGRIKNNYTVDCNDEGASYIEAHVTANMSTILQDPLVPQLDMLLPFINKPHAISSNDFLIGAQVNHFDCGGVAISVCIWHQIADGSSVASFAKTWAMIFSSSEAQIHVNAGVIYDCTSIFPPQNTQDFSWNRFIVKDRVSDNTMKRFVFSGSKLAALREKLGNSSCLDRPSRVETVVAVIWASVMESSDFNTALIAINLRKRLIPPLPELSLGNIYHLGMSMTNCSKNEKNLVDLYKSLAGKTHESIGIMNDEYVRKIHEGGKYFEFMKDVVEKPNLAMKFFIFSSWCRFPFYEVDFGWGKPIWVAANIKVENGAILVDAKDGEGIEAWITLSKKDMTEFEQNTHISSFASFTPTS